MSAQRRTGFGLYTDLLLEDRCTCPHRMVSGGRVDHITMGPIRARVGTTKDCPVHDTCQGYTKANRAQRPEWSNPYCPIHKTKPCPESGDIEHG